MHRGALGAERALVDDVVRVALEVHELAVAARCPTMPQPHEQKLQAVVNSFAPASFSFFAAACASGMLTSSPSARPALPPAASFNQDLRVKLICFVPFRPLSRR